MEKNWFSFKRLFWSYTFCFIPFALLAGLLALFHVSPVYFNETPRYGIEGFAISLFLIPLFGITFGALNWIFLNFGYFLYENFLKLFKKERTL
jgi:hypothetical protein